MCERELMCLNSAKGMSVDDLLGANFADSDADDDEDMPGDDDDDDDADLDADNSDEDDDDDDDQSFASVDDLDGTPPSPSTDIPT